MLTRDGGPGRADVAVVPAGSSRRMAGIDKVMTPIGGRPLLVHGRALDPGRPDRPLLVHDGARPLVTTELVEAVVDAVEAQGRPSRCCRCR